MLSVGSLFSGIGGIDLGLERTGGYQVTWQSEIDPYARRVLERGWPAVPNVGDATTATFPPADVIAGGFPCQPVSQAGNRQGVADDRWLWPAFERAVRKVRPRYVFVENVPGLLSANDGGAFGEVLGDLAALGYDAEWDCIPAQAVGAPHRRDRVCLLAYSDDSGRVHGEAGVLATEAGAQALSLTGASCPAPVAYANGGRLEERDPQRERRTRLQHPTNGSRANLADADRLTVQQPEEESLAQRARRAPRVASGEPREPLPEGGRPGWWLLEPDVGRVVDGFPDRVDRNAWRERLKCLGNAVVPQWAEWVGNRILEAEARLNG